MCIEMNRLLLCSCDTRKKLEELDKYWILYRKGKKSDFLVMGEVAEQGYLEFDCYVTALDKILLSLNSERVFDKDLENIDSDKLHLFIRPSSNQEHWIFAFKFTQGKWVSEKYDPFQVENGFREIKFGDMGE